MTGLRWTLVVPIKAAGDGKTRLATWLEPGPRQQLARAMVEDTLSAAGAARCVDRIVIVTADDPTVVAAVARDATGGGHRSVAIDIVGEPDPAGLNPAVRAGIDRARGVAPTHGVGVLLGDLPALRAVDLEDALAQAGRRPLGVVTDAAGTGTTLLTAAPGQPVDPAFGPGSAAAHLARGHVRIVVDPGSGLAHDVDYREDLDAALALGVGPRTRHALQALPADLHATGRG
ncbi:MAG: 2-phospho-L-lactate guanylyltransferase [Cellulomonas sp.]